MTYEIKQLPGKPYKKDPVYHLGLQTTKYTKSTEMRRLREKLDHELAQNKPGYILTDSVAITWSDEIRHNKRHPLLKFFHRVVWWFTAPESDAWRRWVLYRTGKET